MVQSLSAPIKIDDHEIDVSDWLLYLSEEKHVASMELVEQTAVVAQLAGEGVTTPLGTTCLHQGLVMSEILADLNVDTVTLCAGIIVPCVLYADLKIDDVKDHMGHEVADLIIAMQQLLAIDDLRVALVHPQHHPKVDNVRKMFLAMVSDMRVVLLKLAERVYMMHHLSRLSASQRKRIAKETEAIYAPLANRLGVGDIKWQLEDLSFRYLHPKTYRSISKGLTEKRLDREAFVWSLMPVLRAVIESEGVTVLDLTGRVKHIYSIHKKMKRKKVPITHIYDTTAVRVIVGTVAECYQVLALLHDQWEHVPDEFDDYIAQPKKNGYQSIHTALKIESRKHIEVQIRTMTMHQQAELGVAAHWLYKEDFQKQKRVIMDKIAWLRQMMAWQHDMSEESRALSHTYAQLFEDRVYVFSPKDEVFDLPAGATVLDFAYYVHTDLGHHCQGAKVNGSIVPLSTVLKTADRVVIITDKGATPKRDWLNPHLGYLATARAKAKVHHWFKMLSFEDNVKQGQDMLKKQMRTLGLEERDPEALLPQLRCERMALLYAALGRGDISMPALVSAMQAVYTDQPPVATSWAKPRGGKWLAREAPVHIADMDDMIIRMASCCRPVPGDEVIGYITQGRGITVHQKSCGNVRYFMQKYLDRIITVDWRSQSPEAYPVDVVLHVQDVNAESMGHLQRLCAQEHFTCSACEPRQGGNPCSPQAATTWHVTVHVDSLNGLSIVLAKLATLPFVVDVHRV